MSRHQCEVITALTLVVVAICNDYLLALPHSSSSTATAPAAATTTAAASIDRLPSSTSSSSTHGGQATSRHDSHHQDDDAAPAAVPPPPLVARKVPPSHPSTPHTHGSEEDGGGPPHQLPVRGAPHGDDTNDASLAFGLCAALWALLLRSPDCVVGLTVLATAVAAKWAADANERRGEWHAVVATVTPVASSASLPPSSYAAADVTEAAATTPPAARGGQEEDGMADATDHVGAQRPPFDAAIAAVYTRRHLAVVAACRKLSRLGAVGCAVVAFAHCVSIVTLQASDDGSEHIHPVHLLRFVLLACVLLGVASPESLEIAVRVLLARGLKHVEAAMVPSDALKWVGVRDLSVLAALGDAMAQPAGPAAIRVRFDGPEDCPQCAIAAGALHDALVDRYAGPLAGGRRGGSASSGAAATVSCYGSTVTLDLRSTAPLRAGWSTDIATADAPTNLLLRSPREEAQRATTTTHRPTVSSALPSAIVNGADDVPLLTVVLDVEQRVALMKLDLRPPQLRGHPARAAAAIVHPPPVAARVDAAIAINTLSPPQLRTAAYRDGGVAATYDAEDEFYTRTARAIAQLLYESQQSVSRLDQLVEFTVAISAASVAIVVTIAVIHAVAALAFALLFSSGGHDSGAVAAALIALATSPAPLGAAAIAVLRCLTGHVALLVASTDVPTAAPAGAPLRSGAEEPAHKALTKGRVATNGGGYFAARRVAVVTLVAVELWLCFIVLPEAILSRCASPSPPPLPSAPKPQQQETQEAATAAALSHALCHAAGRMATLAGGAGPLFVPLAPLAWLVARAVWGLLRGGPMAGAMAGAEGTPRHAQSTTVRRRSWV